MWRVGASPRSQARSTWTSTAIPWRAAVRSARLSIAAATPYSSSAAGRSSTISVRRLAISSDHVLDRGLDRRAQLLLAAAQRRREPDAQAGEALERLVVQLARPAPALLLGGLDALPQPLLLDRLAGGDRGRGAGRERAEQALVLVVEAGLVAEVVEGGEHADGAAAERERDQQRGVGLEAEQPQRAVQRRAGVGEPLGALGAQHLARDGALDRHPLVVDARGQLARRRPRTRARRPARARSPACARPTSARARLTISSRMRSRSVSPPSAWAIATVVSRLRTARSRSSRRLLDRRVEPRVVDRDRGPVGEDHDRLLVGVGERAAARPSRSGRGCPRPRRGSSPGRRGTSPSAGARRGTRTSAGARPRCSSRSGRGSSISRPRIPRPRGRSPIAAVRGLVDARP